MCSLQTTFVFFAKGFLTFFLESIGSESASIEGHLKNRGKPPPPPDPLLCNQAYALQYYSP